MKKFGLLSYPGTGNLGDEIQGLAARRFIPRVNRLFNRELLSLNDEGEPDIYWTIMNGWYTHHPEHWPPACCIKPLFLSIHITKTPNELGLYPEHVMLRGPHLQYLASAGPIGARDLSTLRMLRRAGLNSYFSGCLTLTLQRPRVDRDNGLLVLCDVTDEISAFVRQRTGKQVMHASHSIKDFQDDQQRFAQAEELVALYAKASCVVTSRLHCALPCLAIGTPVLFVVNASDLYRFSGLLELVNHCSIDGLLVGNYQYDFDAPAANQTSHLFLRHKLETYVTEFVNA